MSDKVLGLIGMMRKASAVALGEDNVSEAVAKGKVRLVLLPSDVKEKTEQRAERMLEGRSARLIRMPYTNEVMAQAAGRNSCSMMAVLDLGFSNALMRQLQEQYPGIYDSDAEMIRKRLEKTERRKIEKPGVKTKKKENSGG